MPKRKRAAATLPVSPGSPPPGHARKECYDRILWEIRQGFATYAEHYPERVGDERWNQALECSMEGLGGIVAVLESFDLEYPGTCEELREESRRLRATCADLRLRLEARELGDGAEEQGEDP